MKNIRVWFSVMLVCLLAAAGCGSQNSASSPTAENSRDKVSTETAETSEAETTGETMAETTGGSVVDKSTQAQPGSAAGNIDGGEPMVLYIGKDGLFLAANGNTVQVAKGGQIASPSFSGDGTVAAYLKGEDLYGYELEEQTEELLLENVLSFAPDSAAGFYASSKEAGIVKVQPGREAQPIWKPEPVEGGYIQCEKLALSPDGGMLAFTQRRYVDEREDPNTSTFDQSLGIWLLSLRGNASQPKQIGAGEEPFFERLEKTGGAPYPNAWPAKWSPDSTKLFIWRDVLSGSLRSDGIPVSIYDVVSQKTEEPFVSGEDSEWTMDGVVLPYNENVTFAGDGALVLLVGGGREMAFDKQLMQIDSEAGAVAQVLEVLDLVPQSPQVSGDGKVVYFAASKTQKEALKVSYPIWRQIYKLEDGQVTALTEDEAYSSESPILTSDGSTLIFGRQDRDGNMSIWKMDTNGDGLEKLADLGFNTQAEEGSSDYPAGYQDFYGRGSWHEMMDVCLSD